MDASHLTVTPHSLPPELLIQIFSFHVLHNLRNPVSLLLICRTWTSVVLATGKLWTRIMYGTVDMNSLNLEICEEMEGSLYCKDPHSLAKVIKRSGEAKFTLAIGSLPSNDQDTEQEWSTLQILDQNWFRTRCRSLRLFGKHIPPYLKPMFEDLSALEELVCSQMRCVHNPEHDQILAIANRTSSNLSYLSVKGWEHLHKHKQLVRRLRVLELPTDIVEVIGQITLEDFDNIKEMSFFGSLFVKTTQHYDLPPTLRQLTLSHERFSVRPSDFTTLTHLVLQFCSVDNGSMIVCPALTDLTLIYSKEWMIDAPNLKNLTIRGPICAAEPFKSLSFLRPTTLRIDALCLQHYKPGELAPIYSQVQECTVICNVPSRVAVESAKVLLDDTGEVPSFPNLEYLSFICPCVENESDFQRSRLKDQLVGFADELRRSTSFPRLDQIKCGWYQVVKWKHQTVEDAWTRWWDIEWQKLE